jgi:hypothetical protein
VHSLRNAGGSHIFINQHCCIFNNEFLLANSQTNAEVYTAHGVPQFNQFQLFLLTLLLSPISGSLASEACIYALSYDLSGSRLVTCEADKTIKMWKEDLTATPETHPINFKPPKDIQRY